MGGQKNPIRIEYTEQRQNALVRLFWKSENHPKCIVPQKALFSNVDLKTGNGLRGIYSSQYQNLAFTVNHSNLYAISMEWPDKDLVLDVPRPANDAKINLLGCNIDLPWTWSNGKLHVDVTSIGYNQMPCSYAWVFRIRGITLESTF